MVTALVVEDSRTDRELLTNQLQTLRITVVGVQSSEEAMVKIKSLKPDVVFLDIVLPGQSGFEFCRNLKKDKNTQNIPIILYSTKNTEADKLWGSMLGAEAHLGKPVDSDQLAQTLKQVMGEKI